MSDHKNYDEEGDLNARYSHVNGDVEDTYGPGSSYNRNAYEGGHMLKPPTDADTSGKHVVQNFTPTSADLVKRGNAAGMQRVHAMLGQQRLDTNQRTDFNPDHPTIMHPLNQREGQFAEARRRMDAAQHLAMSADAKRESEDPYRTRNADHQENAPYWRSGKNASATENPESN